MPEEAKRRRNNELLAVQNAICLEDNRAFVGREVEILVEGPSKSARSGCRGRRLRRKWSAARHAIGSWSSTARGGWPGQIEKVLVEKADALTLYGSRSGKLVHRGGTEDTERRKDEGMQNE